MAGKRRSPGNKSEAASLVGLERLVQESYDNERFVAEKGGEKPLFDLSVHDLHLRTGDCDEREVTRPSMTSLYELLEAWRILVEKLKANQAFLDYIQMLTVAFLDIDSIHKSEYRHLKTLTDLLTHAVQHHHHHHHHAKDDSSVECRFVTLLEVMMSYGLRWKPSEEVSRFWATLKQQRKRIDQDIDPVAFRRKAYRVLVSLTWVPSSKGLLAACSFDETKQAIDFSHAPVAATVKAHVAKIRGNEPRPRYELVNQMLDRIKDETDVCVAITSDKEGMGKTTLAAQVAAHPAIGRVFTVLWLNHTVRNTLNNAANNNNNNNDEEELFYDRYTAYLDKLCEQIGVKKEWPEQTQRFEEPALTRIRDRVLMKQAKEIMAELIRDLDSHVLLILDDVKDEDFIQWFRFTERLSVILTTLRSNLPNVDWTIEIEPMSQEESAEQFLTEARLPSNHVLGATREVKSIIERCEYNPLTVRTVARWFQLKQVTSGMESAMDDVLQEIDKLTSSYESNGSNSEEEDPNMLLFDILSVMMGPTRVQTKAPSVLFILCFAALVVIFPRKVPLDEVLLLWEQVLKLEPHAVDELTQNGALPQSDETLRKQAWFIAEGLVHMGVIDIDELQGNAWVEVHHSLYREFGTLMAMQMDLKGSFEETVMEWNTSFVAAYFSKRIQGEFGQIDSISWEYAIENLPSHMLKGQMFSAAESVLAEQNFFKARVEALGWKRAMKVHVSDCVDLQLRLDEQNRDVPRNESPVSSVFGQMAQLVKDQAARMLGSTVESVSVEISLVLYSLGFSLARIGHYMHGLKYIEDAQTLLPESEPLCASILYAAGWTLLHANKTDLAMLKIKACRAIMDEGNKQHPLYKDMLHLVGEALVMDCEYREAAEFFLVICEKMKAEADINQIELGSAFYSKGRLHHMMGELVEAEQAFAECLVWKERSNETSKNVAMAFASLGDVLMDLHRAGEAKKCYEDALNILQEINSIKDDIDYQLVTGKLHFLRGDYSSSSVAFDMVQRMISETPTFVFDKSAFDLRCIARTYEARGELGKAIDILQESLALTFQRTSSLERAWGLTDLGNCLNEKGDPQEALMSLEKAVEIQIIKLGESIKVLDSLNVIGSVHVSLRAYDDALGVFRKIYEITERLYGGDIERLAESLYSIAEVFQAKHEHEQATAHLNHCIEILEREQLSRHPLVSKAFQRLGDVAASDEEMDKAHDYYAKAYELRKESNDTVVLAETQHSFGVLARKRGELQLALELLLAALESRRSADNVYRSCETLLEIGNIYRLQQDNESARSIYEKGLELVGEDDADDMATRLNLAVGHLSVSAGDYTDALNRYTRVHELRRAARGRDDMLTGYASRSLGLVNFLMRQGDEAMVHLNEFVRVCEQQEADVCESMDYATAVLLLGDIHNSKGNKDQAKMVWIVSREVCADNGFDNTLPDFVVMIERRLQDDGTKTNMGLFSRLGRLGDGLKLEPEEQKTLENLVFLDE